MRRFVLAAVVVLLVLGVGLLSAIVHRPRGYFSPIFVDGGSAVLVVVRDVRSLVAGFGYEGFSPPAHVRIQRDRFRLVRMDVATGREELLIDFPPSQLEGSTIRAYRNALYGSASAALRPEGGRVQYVVAVTRPDQPRSTTFVLRGSWPADGREPQARWAEGSFTSGGAHAAQLAGPFEVLAVRGDAPMPCAVVLLAQPPETTRALAETDDCRSKFSGGYDVPAVHEQSHRETIERAELLESTHERLVAEARARGLPEYEAELEAIRGMQRLGLYPRPPQLVAQPIEEAADGEPVFVISDEEFEVGLFNDIREALERPGLSVDKDSSPYILHQQFDTSRRLNEYLRSDPASFVVRARGRLWRLTIDRP